MSYVQLVQESFKTIHLINMVVYMTDEALHLSSINRVSSVINQLIGSYVHISPFLFIQLPTGQTDHKLHTHKSS